MNLRPYAYIATGTVLGLAGIALFNTRHNPHPRPLSTTIVTPPVQVSPSGERPSAASAEPAASPTPRPLPPPEAVLDGERVQQMFRDFRTRLGENPVGTNAEIMAAIMGGNRFQANLGPPEGQTLNEQGELLDRWGTPYFFHQLSKTEMEVRSAGPDQTMWTRDDVIVK